MTTDNIDVSDLLGVDESTSSSQEYEDEGQEEKPAKSAKGKGASTQKKGSNVKTYAIGGVLAVVIIGLGVMQISHFFGKGDPEPALAPEASMVPMPQNQNQNQAAIPSDLATGPEGEVAPVDPATQGAPVNATPGADPLAAGAATTAPNPVAAQPALGAAQPAGVAATPVAANVTPVPTPVQVAPAVTMSPAPVASANAVADVNKRIDNLEATLRTILVRLDAIEAGKPRAINAAAPVNPTPKPRRVVRNPDATATPVASKKVEPAKVADVDKPLPEGASGATQAIVAPKTAEVRQSYSVRAVIPGRGWLVNERGDGLSVAVGDVLPTIGRVTAIDVDKATVTTDQGVVIHSASN